MVEKVTDVPLETGCPVLSVNVAVMAEELAPSALMVSGAAVNVIEAVSLVVEINTTVVLWVMPLEVTVISAVPVVVLEIKETVTVPVSSGVVV